MAWKERDNTIIIYRLYDYNKINRPMLRTN